MSIENSGDLHGFVVNNQNSEEKQYLNLAPDTNQNFFVRVVHTLNDKNEQINFSLFQKLNHKLNYIEINVKTPEGQKKVLVNISSLAKRFLMSKKDIRKAKEANVLEKTIHNRQIALITSKQPSALLSSYQHVLSQYEERQGQMVSKTGVQTGLTRQTLEKVLTTALELGLAQKEQATINVGNETYIVHADESQTPQILRLKGAKPLGKGGYGVATQIFNVSTGQLEVIKTAKRGYEAITDLNRLEGKRFNAQVDVQTENLNLIRLHEGHPSGLPGIQDRPRTVLKMGNKEEGFKEVGFIGKIYSGGNARSAAVKPNGIVSKLPEMDKRKVLIDGAYQMAQGIKHFASVGLMHGDIKPDNIFVEVGSKEEISFKIADYGSARFIDDPDIKQILANPGTWNNVKTDIYYPMTDETLAQAALGAKDLNAFKFVQHQRDVFALGVSIYEQMTGKRPYPSIVGRPNLSIPFDGSKLLELGYSPAVCDVLKEMLEPNPYKRLQPAEVEQRWKAISKRGITVTQQASEAPKLMDAFYAGPNSQLAEAFLANNKEKPCYLFRNSSIPGFQAISYVVEETDKSLTFGHYLVKIDHDRQEVAFYADQDAAPSPILTQDEINNMFGKPLILPKL